jgi:formylmethanofuran:tetrahydromethanopterin formyltransferase
MFKITDETRTAAVEAMTEILSKGVNEETVNEAFNAAVDIVKKQFGM